MKVFVEYETYTYVPKMICDDWVLHNWRTAENGKKEKFPSKIFCVDEVRRDSKKVRHEIEYNDMLLNVDEIKTQDGVSRIVKTQLDGDSVILFLKDIFVENKNFSELMRIERDKCVKAINQEAERANKEINKFLEENKITKKWYQFWR